MHNIKVNLIEAAADDILSVLWTNESAWETALIRHGLRSNHMPTPKHQRAYAAVISLRTERKPLDDVLVLDKCGSVVSIDDIALWVGAADTILEQSFVEKIKLVKEQGLKNSTQILLQEASRLITDGKSRRAVTEKLLTDLSQMDVTSDVQNETAGALADELDQMFAAPPIAPLWTGLDWFDGLSGGIGRAKYWAVVAPYKSRKTSTALNIAVGAIMRAYVTGAPIPSIAFMSGEMLTYEIASWIIAMLAVGYLARQDLHEITIPGMNIKTGYITGDMILRAGNGYKRWHPETVKAIDWAREIFRDTFAQQFRAYDKRKERGRLLKFSDVGDAFKRDFLMYKPDLVIVDYLQIFSTGKENDNDFHRVSYGAPFFLDLVKGYQTSFVVLAQQNEEGVRNGTGYSPQVSGGGGLPKSVEYLVENWYKRNEMPDDQLKWKLKLGRHNGNQEAVVKIHPPSGLVFNNSWMKGIVL